MKIPGPISGKIYNFPDSASDLEITEFFKRVEPFRPESKGFLKDVLTGSREAVTETLGGLAQLGGVDVPQITPPESLGAKIGYLGTQAGLMFTPGGLPLKIAGKALPAAAKVISKLPKLVTPKAKIAAGVGTGALYGAGARREETGLTPEAGMAAALGGGLGLATSSVGQALGAGWRGIKQKMGIVPPAGKPPGGKPPVTPGGGGLPPLGLIEKIKREAQALPAREREVKMAEAFGIPLTPAKRTRAEFPKYLEDVMLKMPGASKIAVKQEEKSLSGFNAAIAKEMGFSAKSSALIKAGDKAMDKGAVRRQHKVLSNKYEKLGREIHIDINSPAAAKLADETASIVADYESRVPESLRVSKVYSFINGMMDDIGAGTSGAQLVKLRSEADKIYRSSRRSNPELAEAFNQIHHRIDDAIVDAAPETKKGQYEKLKKQYATNRIVNESLRGQAESAVLKPFKLMANVERRYGDVIRAGNLGELADIGKAMFTPSPDSGTATRMMSQMLLTGGMAGGGAGAGYYYGGDPASAALGTALIFGGPRLGAHLWYGTPAAQRLMRTTGILGSGAARGATRSGAGMAGPVGTGILDPGVR